MAQAPKETKSQQRVRSSQYFKLKKDPKRNFVAVNLKLAFGFTPETVIIERDPSRNNVVRFCAVLTPEEIEKEDQELKKRELARADALKTIEDQKKALEVKEQKEVKQDGNNP